MLRYFTFLIAVACFSRANAQGVITGTLDAVMDETSGITLASSGRAFAYVHNDSGDSCRFFGIDLNGKLTGVFYFKGVEGGRGVKDCEDITSGKSARGNKRYVYLGDIGDNGAKRHCITVYRIPEPVRMKDSIVFVRAVPVFFKYPDGARDAETLMVDNLERVLYIISKREDSVGIYTASLVWKGEDTVMLQKKGSLYFEGIRPGKWITSGDISWDGKKILLKSLQKVFYWKRKNNEPIWQTLQSQATELNYTREPQGEAICFDRKGNGFYTVGEGKNQPVYYYKIVSKTNNEKDKQ